MRCLLLALVSTLAFAASATAQSTRYEPREYQHSGREYAAVVVGSSHCGFSTWEKYVEAIDPMLRSLRQQAHDRGMLFSAIGVAIDDMDRGLEYLARLAKFDEVISGATWLNTGAIQYLWGEGQPDPATPTLVILERTFSAGVDGAPRQMNTRVVKFMTGMDDIMAFAEGGARLPE
jgi:hypothetical protein